MNRPCQDNKDRLSCEAVSVQENDKFTSMKKGTRSMLVVTVVLDANS